MSSDYQQIKSKSVKSVLMLSLRNVLIQSVSVVGFFGLSVILGPSEIGIFAIVTEVVSILGYFSDIGLAPALIQQKAAPSLRQLRSVFTIQQSLVIGSMLIFLFFYPSLASQKNFNQSQNLIVYSLMFAYFAASLKTIPSILLERRLEFDRLSWIDILENVLFYLFALFFAFRGMGLASYAYATIIRATSGLVLIYLASPWSVGLGFDFKSAKSLVLYGIPFQLNSFIALAKDRLSNIMVASIIGARSFGILSWAQKGPRLPLSFMDSVVRVSFPAYSRLQSNPALLSRALSRNLFYIALFIFPAMSLLALTVAPLLDIIPRYQKWNQAITPFYFFCFYFAIAAITTPLTNAFNAVGEVKTTFRFMLMWTALTWLLLPPLSSFFGLGGAVVAYTLIGLSSFIVWYYASRRFSLNIPSLLKQPILFTLLSLLLSLIISWPLQSPWAILVTRLLVFGIIFSLLLYRHLMPDIRWLIGTVRQSFKL